MRSKFQLIKVKTWYLCYEGKVPKKDSEVELINWNNPDTHDYLNLYRSVGEAWGWAGRLLLSESELEKILSSPQNEIWLFKIEDVLRGFFEIDRSEIGKAEIVYLGLLPNEIGKAYGKQFLNTAIVTAALNNSEVWLHTCEYDHPKALEIYLKAGFKIVRESIENEYYSNIFLEQHKKSQS